MIDQAVVENSVLEENLMELFDIDEKKADLFQAKVNKLIENFARAFAKLEAEIQKEVDAALA